MAQLRSGAWSCLGDLTALSPPEPAERPERSAPVGREAAVGPVAAIAPLAAPMVASLPPVPDHVLPCRVCGVRELRMAGLPDGTWACLVHLAEALAARALALAAALGLFLAWPAGLAAQPIPAGAVQILTISKGATAAGAPTSTNLDADRQPLDVFIRGSTVATGGTSATDNSVFTGGTTTVTPMGALFDTTPPTITDGNVGVPRMSSSRILFVDCQSGCAGAAGDGTATGALNALNAAVSIALSTYNGADVNYTAGGTLVGTVVAEVSADGGTTWVAAVFADLTTGAISTSLASPTSGSYFLLYGGSISHVRVRVSAFTSGSTTANLRTTATQPYVLAYGSDGTNLRPLKMDTTGAVQVDVESGTVAATQSGTWTVQPGNTANTTAWLVTGTGGTFPITAASLPLPTGAATEATLAGVLTSANFAAAFGTAGAADTQVMSVQGIASMTPLQVQSNSANLATETTLGGVLTTAAHDAAFGTAGTADAQVRSVQGIASMTPLLTNPGTAANWGVYVEDAGETAGGNLMMTGTVRRDVAASSAGTTGDNATANTDALGLLWSRFLDPCSGAAKGAVPFSISTATTTQLVPADASNKVYICGLHGITAAANNVSLVEDDTAACASPTAGMAGGTTAAAGWNLAANGGLVLGSGLGTMAATAAVNRYVCLITSAATQLSGTLMYVLAP